MMIPCCYVDFQVECMFICRENGILMACLCFARRWALEKTQKRGWLVRRDNLEGVAMSLLLSDE
jgi:hypothetical protein